MNKTFLLALFCILAVSVNAQNKQKPVSKPKPAATKPGANSPLKDLTDSFSYALGVQIGNYYKQQGIKDIRGNALIKGCNDAYGNKVALDDEQINLLMLRVTDPQHYAKLSSNINQGKSFWEQNKKKAGVHTTPSGLQYEVITQGTGPKPTIADTFVCNYRGTLLNGTVFDDSYTRGTPLVYPVAAVIKGWTEALQLMPVGSKYKLYIPYYLAYGVNDNGPSLPGGSLLIFDIELLDIKPKR